jgi:hypothetical protein
MKNSNNKNNINHIINSNRNSITVNDNDNFKRV